MKTSSLSKLEDKTDVPTSPALLRSQKSSVLKKSKKVEEKSPSPAPKKVEKSPAPSSLRKTQIPSTTTTSPPSSILKRLGKKTPKQSPKVRLTRSAAKSSQRVRLVAVSPSASTSSFRKTPKSNQDDDLGKKIIPSLVFYFLSVVLLLFICSLHLYSRQFVKEKYFHLLIFYLTYCCASISIHCYQ